MRRIAPIVVLTLLFTMSAFVAMAANTTEVVTEDDIVRQAHNTAPTNNWVLFTRDTGTGEFDEGPDVPPLGLGSLFLDTPLNNDKVYLFNYDHVGVAMSDIDTISYATYRIATNSPDQVPSLNFQVDVNGDNPGGFTTLVYEPTYSHGAAAIIDGVWQTWDAFDGGAAKWWSTNAIPGVCAFNCFIEWSDILNANPDAVIVGAIGVNQGGGNPGLTAATDALTIGYGGMTTVYDFELEAPPPPIVTPQTKEDCMKGGWQDVTRADGTPFKNQGDCVSSVVANPKSGKN